MPPKFSKELVERTIKYFSEIHDHHVSHETANEYLDSFAELFLCSAEINRRRRSEEIL